MNSFVDIVARFIAEGRYTVSLDDIGEALGVRVVSLADIEILLDELAEAGVTVQPGSMHLPSQLRSVLQAVRAFRLECGRSPTIVELATRLDKSPSEIRASLLYGSVLGR